MTFVIHNEFRLKIIFLFSYMYVRFGSLMLRVFIGLQCFVAVVSIKRWTFLWNEKWREWIFSSLTKRFLFYCYYSPFDYSFSSGSTLISTTICVFKEKWTGAGCWLWLVRNWFCFFNRCFASAFLLPPSWFFFGRSGYNFRNHGTLV